MNVPQQSVPSIKGGKHNYRRLLLACSVLGGPLGVLVFFGYGWAVGNGTDISGLRGAYLYFAIVAGSIIGVIPAVVTGIIAAALRLTANRRGTVGMTLVGAAVSLAFELLVFEALLDGAADGVNVALSMGFMASGAGASLLLSALLPPSVKLAVRPSRSERVE